MLSYHRVLEIFGRSVKDTTLECDCDLHPWDITVDGKSWPGKIRLIGFVDVFFIISYATKDRFMRGIIIYKDSIALKKLDKIRRAGQKERMKPEPAIENDESIDSGDDSYPDSGIALEDYFDDDDSDSGDGEDSFMLSNYMVSALTDLEKAEEPVSKGPEDTTVNEKLYQLTGHNVYKVNSLGHEIGMKTTYSTKSIKRYIIEINRPEVDINRPQELALRRRVRRAIKSHGLVQMAKDIPQFALLKSASLVTQVGGLLFDGGRVHDGLRRNPSGPAGQQGLANEEL